MVGSEQGLDERVFDASDFVHLQIAFIELPVEEAFHDDFMDKGLDASRRGFLQGTAGTFDGIGDHEDCGFTGLGFGARVAEAGFRGVGAMVHVGLACGFAVEVFDQRGAVVLSDEGMQWFRKIVFFREFESILDMPDDDQSAHGGCQ